MFFIFFCFFSLNCWILHPVATFPEKETVWLSDRWKDRTCKNMAEGILAYMELQQRFIHTSALHQWHDEGFTLLVISAHSRLTNQKRSVLRLTGSHHHSFSTFDFLQWLRFTDGACETCRSVCFQYWIVVLCLYLFWKWQSNIHTHFTPWLEVSQLWTCLTLSTLSVSFPVNNQVEHF